MAENGDVTDFTPTANPREHGLFSFFLPLFCIPQLERAREHQPGTSDSAGKSLFASAVRYLGISPSNAPGRGGREGGEERRHFNWV